jgi:hypothetical protein
MSRARRVAVGGVSLITGLLLVTTSAGAVPMDKARLQGLDKITARVSTIDAAVGQAVEFGALEITVRACDKRPPEEPPESAAYLEIVERKVNEAPKLVFSGWMFASSPAVSALEHPIYDIWVLDCISSSTAESGTAQ